MSIKNDPGIRIDTQISDHSPKVIALQKKKHETYILIQTLEIFEGTPIEEKTAKILSMMQELDQPTKV